MARKAGTLAVALTANSTAFERTMARAQGQLKSFGKTVKSTAMTLGVAFGASQLIGAFKSLNGEMDGIAKRSRTLRMDAERYQQFSYAARRTGTEIGTVEAGMKRLDMTLAKAVSGEKGAIDAFRALGLDLAEIRKLQPDQLFDLVAKSLSEITDPAERSAAQLAIFGKNGAELNNFLRDYLKLGDEARSKGLIFKKEELAAAEGLTDAFTDLGTSIKVLVANSGFTSWLNDVAKSMQEIAAAAGYVSNLKGQNAPKAPSVWREMGRNAIRFSLFNPIDAYLAATGRKTLGDRAADAIFGNDENFTIAAATIANVTKANRSRRQRLADAANRAAARARYQAEKTAETATGKSIEKAVKTEKVKEAASNAEGNFSVAALARTLIGGNTPAERTAKATEKTAENTKEQNDWMRKFIENQAGQQLVYM